MKIEDCTSENNQDYSCVTLLNAMEDTIYVIGGKWKLRIIIALSEKPLRFNELQRSLGKISPRVLSNELKDLEENKFINRTVTAFVEYGLAEYSRSLRPVIQSMVSWGISHREKVKTGL